MINANNIVFQRFGSADSEDVDILVFVDEIPSATNACHILCKELELRLSTVFQNKILNINLGIAQNGRLTKVFKGALDETNNALFFTYNLHEQHFENQISKTIPRNVEHKLHRASRIILSHLSRTNERERIKKALNGNIFFKIDVIFELNLMNLDFSQATKKQKRVDVYKSIAFQLGQSLALLDGIEIYTKQEQINHYPDLSTYINRQEDCSLLNLNDYFHLFGKKLMAMKSDFIHENESAFI